MKFLRVLSCALSILLEPRLLKLLNEWSSDFRIPIDELAEVSVAADKAVRNVLSSAEGVQVNNSLKGVIITSLALPTSMRVVTWLRQNLTWMGLTVLPAPPFSVAFLRRSFFSCFVLGVVLSEQLEEFDS